MSYFLGVDVGGTKTHALVADERGRAVGFGVGGPGNWQDVGYRKLGEVLDQVTNTALASAGIAKTEISAAGFGIAGYDWPSQNARHQRVLASLGLACPTALTNDSLIALLAGSREGWGVVLISGTGNNCRGLDRAGNEGRITGEGIRFGEYGGGGEIVFKAVQAIAHEWTRRSPPTLLTQAFIRMAGAKDLTDLIEGIDTRRYQPEAGWALEVFRVAQNGDRVACEIVDWSARELGESACGVIRQLGIQNEIFDVVLAGSVFEAGDIYARPLGETIHMLAPGACPTRLSAPPVIGAVRLAMRAVKLDAASRFDVLTQSTKARFGNLFSQPK